MIRTQNTCHAGTHTPTRAARTTRGMLKKVASDVVTASPSDMELILIDTLSGSAA